jgi:protein SCO1/2
MRSAHRLSPALAAAWHVLPFVLLCVATPSCKRQAPPAQEQRYPLAGRVVSVDSPHRTVTIAHGDIPGLMPAMTMSFVVLPEDAALLGRTGPGDEVTATLVSRDSRFWLTDLVVVRRGPPRPSVRAAAPDSELAPGEMLPDVTLVDQDGRGFRLGTLRGKSLALTFVFTRCPFPEFCPLLMRNFAHAEAALVADPALRERTRLLTVSFDPRHDTPRVLRAFGEPFQKTKPPFGHWLLATGKDEAIRRLGGALGLEYEPDSDSFVHNLRTAVVSPQGTLARLFRGNDWTPEELVAELRTAAGAAGEPGQPAKP